MAMAVDECSVTLRVIRDSTWFNHVFHRWNFTRLGKWSFHQRRHCAARNGASKSVILWIVHVLARYIWIILNNKPVTQWCNTWICIWGKPHEEGPQKNLDGCSAMRLQQPWLLDCLWSVVRNYDSSMTEHNSNCLKHLDTYPYEIVLDSIGLVSTTCKMHQSVKSVSNAPGHVASRASCWTFWSWKSIEHYAPLSQHMNCLNDSAWVSHSTE